MCNNLQLGHPSLCIELRLRRLRCSRWPSHQMMWKWLQSGLNHYPCVRNTENCTSCHERSGKNWFSNKIPIHVEVSWNKDTLKSSILHHFIMISHYKPSNFGGTPPWPWKPSMNPSELDAFSSSQETIWPRSREHRSFPEALHASCPQGTLVEDLMATGPPHLVNRTS